MLTDVTIYLTNGGDLVIKDVEDPNKLAEDIAVARKKGNMTNHVVSNKKQRVWLNPDNIVAIYWEDK